MVDMTLTRALSTRCNFSTILGPINSLPVRLVDGRSSSRVNEEMGVGYPSVRLPRLTMNWDLDPQNLVEEGKKGGNFGERDRSVR
jgi:hypothetical protein